MTEDRNRRFAPLVGAGALWRGEGELGVVFWWHAMVVGTLLNVLTTFVFVALQTMHVSNVASLAAFVLPVPYNLFVAVAVWRSAGRYAGPPLRAQLARLAVSLWAIGASLI